MGRREREEQKKRKVDKGLGLKVEGLEARDKGRKARKK